MTPASSNSSAQSPLWNLCSCDSIAAQRLPKTGSGAGLRGPVLIGISDLGTTLRPPLSPRSPPCKFPRLPCLAVLAVSAVALPSRPAGIHGVRPPRGKPQVIVPSLAECLVPAVTAAVAFASAASAINPAARGATFAPRLPFPAPSCACVVAAGVAACAVAVRADVPPWDGNGCAGSRGDCPCRSQPRRGPRDPRPSPAPSRLGAGWARVFFLDAFSQEGETMPPVAHPDLSPTRWPCTCVSASAAAASVLADEPPACPASPFEPSSCRLAAAATATASSAAFGE
ncbi:unnamed protein product [Closterium sp. NIES-64]|nr:unnamed protein product [Closterium sp. NIES-64]